MEERNLRTAIVWLGHGTRSEKGTLEFLSLTERMEVLIQERIPAQILARSSLYFTHSFLELREPDLLTALTKCHRHGIRRVLIVPIFLFAAGHLKHDVPSLLVDARQKMPDLDIHISDAMGVDESLIDIAATRALEAGFPAQSTDHRSTDGFAIALVGRGNRDIAALQQFQAFATGLSSRLNHPSMTTCFLAGSGTQLEDGLNALLVHQPSTIIVVPYLLFSGYLTNHLPSIVGAWHSRHPEVPSIVIAHHLGPDPNLALRWVEKLRFEV